MLFRIPAEAASASKSTNAASNSAQTKPASVVEIQQEFLPVMLDRSQRQEGEDPAG